MKGVSVSVGHQRKLIPKSNLRVRVILVHPTVHIKFSTILRCNLCNALHSGPKKTMTATDVTGFESFDAIFSTGFFATFSRFWGARLTKLHREPGEKAKNPVESLQWRRRPEIADFCPLSWSNVS